jgi:hypothetical protein
MKSRIRKFALYAALATPVSYGAGHALRSVSVSDVTETVKFYADIPSRFNEAVTNFKMLPERMDPTCSECN